jgi:hypothetical protein
MARWRNYFTQLLSKYGVNDVRQTEIHVTDALVPEPSASEFEMVIEKLKRHKLPCTDLIQAEMIKEGARTIHFEIHKIILFGKRRNCLKNGRS